MLEVSRLRKSYGTLVAVDDVSFGRRPRHDARPARPERGGEDDDAVDDRRTRHARQRQGRDRRPRRSAATPIPRSDRSASCRRISRSTRSSRRATTCASSARCTTGRARARRRPSRRALETVGLADRAGDKVKAFSGGMKRRLNLASGLLHDPDILLLDEPTVGVDPQSRNAIFDNLEQLKAQGKTLLYTTHYMEEVERLADRIVVDGPRACDRRRHAGRPHDTAARLAGRSLPHPHRTEPERLMALIPLRAMVKKDLQLFFSDRRAVIMAFAAPIAIASFFGFISAARRTTDSRRGSTYSSRTRTRARSRRRSSPA